MAFDQPTRTRLQKFVSDTRGLLVREFTRQLQNDYGMDPSSGSISPLESLRDDLPDAHRESARILRETLAHYVASAPSGDNIEALDRIIREQAFTILNRLAALRMAEARELLIESISQGYNSKGFQLYLRLAGPGLGETGSAYREYVFSIFDEFAVDLAVLFDRFSPQGLLFPREPAVLEALRLVNDPEIAGLWTEDETIGWIYQYFNSKEERKKMRDESTAPRNSRELAVRNQFFTPRYVVEFLTDNTLGRIWYDMRKGETRLKEQCRYLVRRPNEIFLEADQEAPAAPPQDSLSEAELFREPVYIPHRPLKDPREIRMLDPACGSMHFGLYAFDVFETIYEEAWEIAHAAGAPKAASGFNPFVSFVVQYPDKNAFLADVPRLIIQHNLHGIDIDIRAVQIAGLSLWLRAQQSWLRLRLRPKDRPRVRRSNIVSAEPMPGEETLLIEFIETHLAPTPERRLLGQLVRHVFNAMRLTGEAGSLLRIEREISGAVSKAKQAWLSGPMPVQVRLFADDPARPVQKQLGFDVTVISDETFWERAEERIVAALHSYAEVAGDYQRRLFADDGARGFGFIDVCRKRYDVVLMNPPFGEASKGTKEWAATEYPRTKQDLLASFCERGLELLVNDGMLGEISSRVAFFLKSFAQWRLEILTSIQVPSIVDLGSDVLDDAMVEAACYVLVKPRPQKISPSFVIRLVLAADKGKDLLYAISHDTDARRFFVPIDHGRPLRHSPLIYWVSRSTIEAIAAQPPLEPQFARVRQGLSTGDDNRFVRAAWEVSPELLATTTAPTDDFARLFQRGKRWAYHVRSGSSQPWYSPLTLVIDWEKQGYRLKELWVHKGENPSRYIRSEASYFKPGFSWTRRAFRFIPYVIPRGCIPSASRYMGYPHPGKEIEVLALSASNLATAFMRFYGEKFEYPNYLVETVKRLPCVELDLALTNELAKLVRDEVSRRREYYRNCEPFIDFTVPRLVKDWSTASGAEWNGRTFLGHELELKVAREFGMDDIQLSELEKDLLDAVEACKKNPPPNVNEEDEAEDDNTPDFSSAGQHIDLVSYIVGCAFGRWDVRFTTGDKAVPALTDPFAPLPACPPGQLQNDQGLPLTYSDVEQLAAKGLWNYPLEIPWDGILVDDPGNELDIETRFRHVLKVIWKDRHEAMERETCEVLGVDSLRAYLCKPSGFFAEHLDRYSKSRRQAPIYWPLSTSRGSYTVWIYYHRLNSQTLYTCVNEFVDPKLQDTGDALHRLKASGAQRSSKDEKDLERLYELQVELQELRDELLRLARLPWNPNLNDGVKITACPLWKLFRLADWRNTLRETWEKLERGDYNWAHLAYTLWPARVRDKCRADKSLAVAHGLEELYEESVQPARKKRARKAQAQVVEEE